MLSAEKLRQEGIEPMDMTDEEAGPSAPSRRRKQVVILVLLAALGAGSYYFMLRPAGSEDRVELGPVTVLEPVQLNLAQGRYLKIGVALQANAEVEEELDGTKALDSIVELFSGQTIEELATAKPRRELKAELLKDLQERYGGEVVDVYFTEFVTQ